MKPSNGGILWAAENPPEMLAESYVNLVPTVQGGTHVNGLRAGLTEAMREFCEIRKPVAARGYKWHPKMSGKTAIMCCR